MVENRCAIVKEVLLTTFLKLSNTYFSTSESNALVASSNKKKFYYLRRALANAILCF